MSASVTESIGMTTYRAGSNAAGTALSRIRGTLPFPTFLANAATGAVVWSDGGAGGSFAPFGTNNATAVYTPANKTQAVTISATDPTNTQTRALTVFGTIPVQPQMGFETEGDIDTKVKFAKDRTRYFREDGGIELGWVWGWDKRELDQKVELWQFWKDHRKVNQFYMVDVEGNIQNLVWFTSSLKWVTDGANRFSLAASMKGIDEGVTATAAAPLSLQINCGGYPVTPYQADQYYTNGFTFWFAGITPNTSGVSSPAPDEVYRWVRDGDPYLEYLITGLRLSHPYDVKLHFIADAARTMTPAIQGVSQTNVTVAAGYVAIKTTYAAVVSDVAGQIRIRVTKVSGANALIAAIEVLEN